MSKSARSAWPTRAAVIRKVSPSPGDAGGELLVAGAVLLDVEKAYRDVAELDSEPKLGAVLFVRIAQALDAHRLERARRGVDPLFAAHRIAVVGQALAVGHVV